MIRARRYLVAILAVLSLIAMVGSADAQGKGQGKGKGKHHHFSGQQLLGGKVKTNGNHVIHKNGKYTASATVKDGKIAGVNVKHSEKGDVPVKKYKTTKKMAMKMDESNGVSLVSYRSVLEQTQDLGMTYIGYSYTDEYGDEYIYWFPYEMIFDGDTGAIEYVPLS
jgi:major membrane immunogen (membrane-anchored lipoprotein)